MSVFLNTRGKASLAIAICDRCKMKRSITQLVADPNFPGLRVCEDTCVDLFDPWRLPARMTEDITLRYPRPDEPLEAGDDTVNEDDGFFPSPPPNSTPGVIPAQLTLTGVLVQSFLGTITGSVQTNTNPGTQVPLTGNVAVTALGNVNAIPATVFLTGVEAVGLVSLNSQTQPIVLGLRGVRATSAIGFFGGVPTVPPPATPPAGFLNIINIIKGLQVASGPFAGHFLYTPNGNGMWYWANIALASICQYLSLTDMDAYIRPYLDLYIANLKSDNTIDDVLFTVGQSDPTQFTLQTATSHDSYASSFLTLVRAYLTGSQNFAWWDTNKPRLLQLADNNIRLNTRADGLVASFQFPTRFTTDVGVLVNNCFDYRGLTDLAAILNLRGDTTNANLYTTAKLNLASNIDVALHMATGALSPGFKADDLPTTGLSARFYPDVLGHAYLQAFALTEESGRFTESYSYINTNAPGWENCAYDPNPWLVIGLTAALRLDNTKANTQLSFVDNAYTANPASIGINELGMYQRIKSVLAGLPPV